MMISPAGANDPYAAAAALDRQLRSASSDSGDAPSDSSVLESGPDVVVTLSKGSAPAPSTYDASGRMSRASDSTGRTGEPDGDDDDSPADATDTTSASAAPSADDDSSADASVDEDAAVAA
jgi:hypothetical protein